MPFCDNSGDLIQLQTKINEISDREISYRKETNSDSLHRWKQLSLRKQQCTLKAVSYTHLYKRQPLYRKCGGGGEAGSVFRRSGIHGIQKAFPEGEDDGNERRAGNMCKEGIAV